MGNAKEILDLVQIVGFPIVVATYLLWRYDGKLGELIRILTVMQGQMGTQNEVSKKSLELQENANTDLKILLMERKSR